MNYNKTLAFTAACVGMSFFGISMITLGTVLPSLTSKLMLNTLQASELVTFLPLGILAGSILFGPVVDHFGHRVLFFIGCLLVLFGLTGITYFKQILPLQLSILIVGLGGGILNGETNALVADIYDDTQRGAKLSLLGAFYGIGAIGIPVLTGFLSKYYSFEIIIRSISVVMFACIVLCIPIRFPKPRQPQSFPIRQGFKLLRSGMLLLLSLILFFESGIEGTCNNWTALYLNKTSTIGHNLILQTLTCMVVALTVSRLCLAVILKKIRQDYILMGCFAIALIGFILLYISSDFGVAAIGMICVGIGTSATFPIILNIIGKEYSAFVGTAFGVAITIGVIGNVFINNLTGILSSTFGITFYPIIMASSVIIMILLYQIRFLLTSKN